MTEQQQSACAELARRMGWRTVQYRHIGTGSCWKLINPRNEEVESALASEVAAYFYAPDYFNSPVASRELMAWLAADDDRWFLFILQLIKLIDWPTQSAHKIADATFAEIASEVRYLMTAPLPIIARAACKALGIEVSE